MRLLRAEKGGSPGQVPFSLAANPSQVNLWSASQLRLDGVDAKKKDHFVLDSFFEAARQKSQTRSVMRLCTRWRNDKRVVLREMTSKVSRRVYTRHAPTQSVEKVHGISNA